MRDFFRSILLIAIFSTLLVTVVSANSAKPPSFVVILRNAPPGIVVSNIYSNAEGKEVRIEGTRKQFNGVNYIAFYDGHWENAVLSVENGNDVFVVKIPEGVVTVGSYESIITLDYKNRSIYAGELATRSIAFIPLRIISTLIFEGIIFMLFRFNEKRSWYVFVIANILTQAALNVAIINNLNPFNSYYIFSLAFYELLVIVAEIIIYKTFIKEKRPIILFTIVANLVSWIIGGWVLAILPI